MKRLTRLAAMACLSTTMLAAAPMAMAQFCTPEDLHPRFIYVHSPFVGWVHLDRGNVSEAAITWRSANSRMLSVASIESVSTLTVGGRRGAVIRSRVLEGSFASSTGTVAYQDNLMVVYWVRGHTMQSIMDRVWCATSGAASVAPKSPEQQERDEVRDWQTLRALEELAPGDLL